MTNETKFRVPLNGASAHDQGFALIDNPMRSESGKIAWESQFRRELERRRSLKHAS